MRFPIFMMIIVPLLILSVGAYILYDVRTYSTKIRRKRATWICLGTELIVLALCVAAVLMLVVTGDAEIQLVMWLLFSFFSILISAILYCICSLIGRLCNINSHRLVNYGAMIGVPVAAVVFTTMWWGALFTRNNIQVRHADVVSSKVPEAFDGYRIVQFSDIHLGTWGRDTTFISNLVDSINSLNPDLIVFTGDIVNRSTNEMEPFNTVLRRLKARDGVYSILGNHDYGDYVEWESPLAKAANMELMKQWQRQIGWKLLNNSYEFIHKGNDSIALIGVGNWGEPPFAQYGDLNKAYPKMSQRHLNDNNFKILLSHNPEHWVQEVKNKSNIDLTLSGHTHAMQMEMDIAGKRLSPAAWKYHCWGGMYEDETSLGNSKLYVNIGAGEVGIPMRIGATPELTVLTLRRTDKK